MFELETIINRYNFKEKNKISMSANNTLEELSHLTNFLYKIISNTAIAFYCLCSGAKLRLSDMDGKR
jgi:redox-regulated HSP33 family molecular chaperone